MERFCYLFKKLSKCFYFYFVFFVVPFSHIITATAPRFGPFYVHTKNVFKCTSNPMDKEHFFVSNVAIYRRSKYTEEAIGIMHLPMTIENPSGIIGVDIWRDGGFQSMFSLPLDKPCEQPFFGKVIRKFFGNVTKDCTLQKGNYTTTGLDPTVMTQSLVGKKFFYEKIQITINWFTRKGLIFCAKVVAETKPLPKDYYQHQKPELQSTRKT